MICIEMLLLAFFDLSTFDNILCNAIGFVSLAICKVAFIYFVIVSF